MRSLIKPIALAALLAVSATAQAQTPEFFAAKPFTWRETDLDRRFMKTRAAQALAQAPEDPACARVVASLLMAFAESAPYFHRRDDGFVFFKAIVDPITSDEFPAEAYVRHMVRRAMLDKKAPEAWLATGRQLVARHGAPIDLARLAYAVDGAQLVDSFYFGLPQFLDLFRNQVLLAPTVAGDAAVKRFVDSYLDRDVVWGGLQLIDIHKVEPPKPPKGRKKATPPPADDERAEGPEYLATLIVPQPPPANPLFETKQTEPIRVSVTLQLEQYLDVRKTQRGGRYLVRGRFWGFQPGTGEPGSPPMLFDIRDGILFEERDWTGYRGFATREDAAACELCVNDLSMLGLKKKRGVLGRDGFAH